MEGDEVLIPAKAARLQRSAQVLGQLLIWTVTYNTTDYQGRWVARPAMFPTSARLSKAEPEALLGVLIADSLDGLREMLPPGLNVLARQEGDEPVIVEVWL